MTTADVKAVFDVVRPRQIALLKAIAARPQVDDAVLRQPFPESGLLQFSVDVASAFGFDWTRGRQDKSTHPFATAIGCDDVRITTRFMDRYPFSLLFGTLHETGHALYEQGVARAHHRTQLEGGASLGVHESQSRLWENLVGRSRPFWEHFYPDSASESAGAAPRRDRRSVLPGDQQGGAVAHPRRSRRGHLQHARDDARRARDRARSKDASRSRTCPRHGTG